MFVQNKTNNIQGKWLAVTIVLGIAAFLLSPSGPLGGFWGLHSESPTPQGIQKGLFILLALIQSLAFGFGFAFLFFGRDAVRSLLPAEGGLSLAVYLAIAWSLLSWWPHTNLHQTHGPDNINGLLAIEYGFHVTLILGAVVIAYFILTKSKQNQ